VTPSPPPSRAALVAGAVVGVALCALATALFPAVWAAGLDHPIAHGANEDWDWQLTLWEATRVQWAQGMLPTWCPWVSGGVPLLGNPESPALFPGFAVVLALGTVPGLKVLLLLQWWILVAGGWAAGRTLGLSPVSAHFGSLALLASSFLPEFVGWGHQMFLGICWLPAAWAAQRSGRWATAGVLLAMPMLQGAHYVFFFGVLWLVLDAALTALDERRLRWLAPGLVLNGIALDAHGGAAIGWGVGALLVLGLCAQRPARGAHEPADSLLPLGATLAVAGLLVLPKVVAALELVGVSGRLTRDTLSTALNSPYDAGTAWKVLTGAIDRPAGHEGQNVFHHVVPVLAGGVGLVAAAWRRPTWGLLGLLLWSCGWAGATPVNLLEGVHRLPGFELLAKIERYSLVWSVFLGWGIGLVSDTAWARGRWLGAALVAVGTGLWLAAALPHARTDILSVDPAAEAPPGTFFTRRGGVMPGFESVRANQGRLDLSIAAPPDAPAPGLRGREEPGYAGEAYEVSTRAPVPVTVSGSHIDVAPTGPGEVVLNQGWYPGWRVDGRPTHAVDGLIAAELRPGPHRFRYWPAGLTLALLLHGLGWGLAALGWRRGR
jgi:hypothetical protein